MAGEITFNANSDFEEWLSCLSTKRDFKHGDKQLEGFSSNRIVIAANPASPTSCRAALWNGYWQIITCAASLAAPTTARYRNRLQCHFACG
jgi:hypothetical protein